MFFLIATPEHLQDGMARGAAEVVVDVANPERVNEELVKELRIHKSDLQSKSHHDLWIYLETTTQIQN